MSARLAGLSPARVIGLVAALAGLGVSIYLTIEHYNRHVSLACPENATINCAKVTTSKWSELAGIPVAVLGLAYFVVLVAVLAAPLRGAMDTVRLGLATLGILFVLYLVYVELFQVDAICLWCTAVHVLTLVVFVSALWEWSARAAERPGSTPATARTGRRSSSGR